MKSPSRVRLPVIGLALIGLFAGFHGTAWAQRGPGRSGFNRADVERRLQQQFGQIVRRQLGLDTEQQEAIASTLQSFEEQRRSIAQREQILRIRLRGQAGPLGGEPQVTALLSDEEAQAILDEMAALQEAEARLRSEEQARLLDVLTVPQMVRFHALREALSERVRRLRQGPGGRRGGRGGGGRQAPLQGGGAQGR